MSDNIDIKDALALHSQLTKDIGKIITSRDKNGVMIFDSLNAKSREDILRILAYDPVRLGPMFIQIDEMWGVLIALMSMTTTDTYVYRKVPDYEKIIVHMDAASYFVRTFPPDLKAIYKLFDYLIIEDKSYTVGEAAALILKTVREDNSMPMDAEVWHYYSHIVSKYGSWTDKLWKVFFSVMITERN